MEMTMKKYFVVYLIPLLLITACKNGGGGTAGPGGGGGPGTDQTPLYPSSKNSVYVINKTAMKANVEAIFSVTAKDQLHNDITLGTKWNITIQVTCPYCQSDANISVTKITPIEGNVYKYRFTPSESAEYLIETNFSPSAAYNTFSADFPGSIDPDNLYALALSVPAYDVCNDPADPSLHGLRGTQIIASVSRMAICTPSELALVSSDSFFLDQDLFLAKNIDLNSYYQNSGAEFSIGNDCPDAGNCAIFTGSFYGNMKTISKFQRSNRPGLFGRVAGDSSNTARGVVSYLTLDDSTQTGSSGGLIAYGMQSEAKVIGVHVTNSQISGTDIVGGIVGSMENSYILASNSSASVTSKNVSGGLVGYTSATATGLSRVSASSSSGIVKVENMIPTVNGNFAGGLVGKSDQKLEVFNSFFNGQVSSEAVSGGLVGKLFGTISSSYVSGSVFGQTSAGGLSGETDSNFSNIVNKSFVSSNISGNGLIGAIAGSCNHLNSDRFFINSLALVECGGTNTYASTNVSRGNYSTTSSLSNGIKASLLSWTWDQSVWIISDTILPIIH
jgi:hypothetical protein